MNTGEVYILKILGALLCLELLQHHIHLGRAFCSMLHSIFKNQRLRKCGYIEIDCVQIWNSKSFQI